MTIVCAPVPKTGAIPIKFQLWAIYATYCEKTQPFQGQELRYDEAWRFDGIAAHALFRLTSRTSVKEPKMNSSTREGLALPAIQLPLPANDRGMSLFAALQQRKTTREISATPLPLQLLSNLLWGGATGIGYAMAEAFLEAGSTVAVCGRTAQRLLEARAKHPELLTRVCDVSKEEDRKGLMVWTATHLPGLNVLVNNAGVQRDVDFTQGIDDFR
jgi:hypothetical protein